MKRHQCRFPIDLRVNRSITDNAINVFVRNFYPRDLQHFCNFSLLSILKCQIKSLLFVHVKSSTNPVAGDDDAAWCKDYDTIYQRFNDQNRSKRHQDQQIYYHNLKIKQIRGTAKLYFKISLPW